MKKHGVVSQLIVVDANVLRGAAAVDGGPPAGAECRRALVAILEICHRAVVSPALTAEYERHASNFGRRWWVAMAKRKKVVATPARETGRARGWRQDPVFSKSEREAIDKDLHLVLAARETNGVVLSADDAARSLFARLADLKALGWARMTADDIDDWLLDGASGSRVALGSR
jgi:hypothetical protein